MKEKKNTDKKEKKAGKDGKIKMWEKKKRVGEGTLYSVNISKIWYLIHRLEFNPLSHTSQG